MKDIYNTVGFLSKGLYYYYFYFFTTSHGLAPVVLYVAEVV